MSINKKLQSIYCNNWETLQQSLQQLESGQYTNPFLIAFDEDLLSKSDLKVMIFGQETKGWGDRFGMLNSPEAAVAMYEAFFCQKQFYGGYGKSALAKVSSEYLPLRTIRMYHPSYFGGFYKVRESAVKLVTGVDL